MRVFVTGAGGFVGRHVVRILALRGHEVVAGVHSAGGSGKTVDVEGASACVGIEMTDLHSVADALRAAEPEAIAHLAGGSSVRDSWEMPAEAMTVHAVGAARLVRAVQELPSALKPSALLLVGSAEAYGTEGTDQAPLLEDNQLRPRTPYGAAKASQEMVGWVAAASIPGLRVIQARSFLHTGPGQRPPFAFADWSTQLIRISQGAQAPVLRVGDLDIVRDLTDVRDVAQAYSLLLENAHCQGVYNVCTGEGLKLRSVLQHLQRIAGVTARLEVASNRVRPVDIQSLVGSPSRLQGDTKWRGEFDIQVTLHDLMSDLRDNLF